MPLALPAIDFFAPCLIFARIGAMLSVLPGFSAMYVSVRIRLLLALSISLLLTPLLGDRLPPMPASAIPLALLISGETLIGAFIGSIARILVSALHVAGTLTAYYSSLASALVHDPVADQQSATLAGFFTTLGLILVFATDLHHLMLRAMIEGYETFPPGQMPSFDDLAATVGRLVADSFVLGVQLSAPFLIVGIGYQVALGLLGRLMPQLSVYFFGLPLQIGVQIWVLMLTLSGVMLVFLDHLGTALTDPGAP